MIAEEAYREKFGCYTNLVTLEEVNYITEFGDDYPYKLNLVLKENSFIAIATHRKRPKTRSKFEVGPDQKIRRIDPENK